jgi:hypothetical protein
VDRWSTEQFSLDCAAQYGLMLDSGVLQSVLTSRK